MKFTKEKVLGLNTDKMSPRVRAILENRPASDRKGAIWTVNQDWRECYCVAGQILNLCGEGKFEVWIVNRGFYDRRVQDTLLNGLLAHVALEVGEWDSVGFSLRNPDDEELLMTILFLPLIAHWGLVGHNLDTDVVFTVDNDSEVWVLGNSSR